MNMTLLKVSFHEPKLSGHGSALPPSWRTRASVLPVLPTAKIGSSALLAAGASTAVSSTLMLRSVGPTDSWNDTFAVSCCV